MPFQAPDGRKLPDSDRYRNRFQIESDSSNKKYTIAFDMARNAGYWTCSCPGCCTQGQCKHLTRFGYHGRKYGSSHPDNQSMIRELTGKNSVRPEMGPKPTFIKGAPIVPEPELVKDEVPVPLWTAADVAEAAMEFEVN